MKLIKPTLATIAAFVVLMIVEITWHDTLFATYYDAIPYVVREEPRFTAPTIAFLVRAILMSVLYRYVRRRGSLIVSGLLFGGVIGLLTAIYWIPSYYAQQPIPEASPWFVIEGAFFLIQGGATGLAIALVYWKGASQESIRT